ncbi:MAG: permease [Anaerolineae bacterium]|nr:permease [Anaerolineae bacterium]
MEQLTTFATIFLGIFIEAAPFLLLGSLASGLVEVFISKDDMARVVPRNLIGATIVGGMMGFVFPVCECGVVPLVRRLFNKGIPISMGVAFLLAAPIINPVALASTYAAYGFGDMLMLRFSMGLLVATSIGLLFSLNPRPLSILRPGSIPAFAGASPQASQKPHKATKHIEKMNLVQVKQPMHQRLQMSLRFASDDFFDMGKYLVIGSMLAAGMQTVVSQSTLTDLGSGPVSSVLTMQLLAFVLSVCSTVDAFISLAFRNTFTTGSILSFLVFGPMVDIKSTMMFLNVFNRKIVLYLILLPFLMTLLIGIFINLNVGI